MTTKTKIYNLACSALLLSRNIADAETDTSNEVKVLNQFWDDALASTLSELDLDSLSENISLELIEEINDNGPWTYAYKYPSKCAFLRRIESGAVVDSRATAIAKRVGQYKNQKAIYTNEYQARAEIIAKDISLAYLSPNATWALAYKLATLASPLIVGKGARTLRDELEVKYMKYLTDAQAIDDRENFNYDSPEVRSEFVAARME